MRNGRTRTDGMSRRPLESVPLQIDIGFGYMVTPEPARIHFPKSLIASTPVLRIYPPEVVIGEKLHAMVFSTFAIAA